MSDIEGELARVRGAFDKPTLRLLDRKWAPFVLAVFNSSFEQLTHPDWAGVRRVEQERIPLTVALAAVLGTLRHQE